MQVGRNILVLYTYIGPQAGRNILVLYPYMVAGKVGNFARKVKKQLKCNYRLINKVQH